MNLLKVFVYPFLLLAISGIFAGERDRVQLSSKKSTCLEFLGEIRKGARFWEVRTFKEQEKFMVQQARLSVSQRAANMAAGKLYLNLKEAAQAIQGKKLRRAYMHLNNGDCFEGTHIQILPFANRIARVLELDRFNFSQDFIENVVRSSKLNYDIYFSLKFDPYLLKGTVSIIEIMIALGPIEYSVWEKRFDGNGLVEAVRLNHVLGLFEEKAHALQHLNEVLGLRPYIRLNSQEIFETEKMEDQLNSEREERGESSVNFAQEADVYAFMYDLVESENLPKGYSVYSGYLTRAIIDRNRGRPWTQIEWKEGLDEYNYNSRPLP